MWRLKTAGCSASTMAEKWARLNEDRSLRQRVSYYTRIYADTEDEDKVYGVNVAYHVSKDGGKTFTAKYAPHGRPPRPLDRTRRFRRMIMGDDGGAQVVYDGDTWSTYHNQPTAQLYRVITDDDFPYRTGVAQQDNSTLRIRHRTEGATIGESDWEPTAGGESGHIAIDPADNDIVYGGSYHGYLIRVDHWRKTPRSVNVWPRRQHGPRRRKDARYRFLRNFSDTFSPHDPKETVRGVEPPARHYRCRVVAIKPSVRT
ncbi:MAG: hypothetical protein IPM36_24765 [Lewinellaceae bacterium]|nr:hypothetical protein [Lewinellaceae bacterium]